MFRGDVWDAQFPSSIGSRPCVVLTVNALIRKLGAITVAEITSTEGPASTHVAVDPDVGLTGRDQSWINTTALHTIPAGRLRRCRGRLSPAELDGLNAALRLYLDLD